MSRFFGLVNKRERWGISTRGYVVFAVCFVVGVALAIFWVHPFLARTDREPADILIVEGWLPDYAIKQAAEEFQSGGYKSILVTGGPLGQGTALSRFDSFAAVGAATLEADGVAANALVILPSKYTKRGRTYECASTVNAWLLKKGVEPIGVNIVTSGTHARRTQLLYRKVLAKRMPVGVISIASAEYDSDHWWQYSAGVKAVIGDVSGYINALFFGR
jgi:uncharacterized SAM-binding protein YcdF (DUF218 family)